MVWVCTMVIAKNAKLHQSECTYTISPRVGSMSTCHSLPDLHLLHGKENPCQGEDIVGNWIAIVFVGEIQRNSFLLMRTKVDQDASKVGRWHPIRAKGSKIFWSRIKDII